jgi:hypothetical protein
MGKFDHTFAEKKLATSLTPIVPIDSGAHAFATAGHNPARFRGI